MNPSKRGKKYKDIVNRGCGCYKTYDGDYDCEHRYDWECDNCPCCIEHRKNNKGNEGINCINLVGW